MNLTINLVWASDSQPDNTLRKKLRDALLEVGILPCWQEYHAKQRKIPSIYRGIKNNLISINDHKVYDAGQSSILSQSELAQKIINYNKYPKLKRRLNINTSLIPAILIAIFPKCPFCLATYMGVLGVTGLGALPHYAWFGYVLALSLSGVILLISYRALQRKIYLPIYFVIPGSAILIVGKLVYGSSLLTGIGLALISAASVINALPPIHIKRISVN